MFHTKDLIMDELSKFQNDIEKMEKMSERNGVLAVALWLQRQQSRYMKDPIACSLIAKEILDNKDSILEFSDKLIDDPDK